MVSGRGRGLHWLNARTQTKSQMLTWQSHPGTRVCSFESWCRVPLMDKVYLVGGGAGHRLLTTPPPHALLLGVPGQAELLTLGEVWGALGSLAAVAAFY